jgi:hypothetical protein
MRKFIFLFLILTINFSYSQLKGELINSVIKSNQIHLDYEYKDFGDIVNIMTENEIYELTEHKNSVLRTYSKIGLINKGKGNIIDFLKNELEKNETIDVFDGCLGDYKTTSTIIYEAYLNKKKLDTLSYFKDLEFSEIDSIVLKSSIFKQIDSTIIYSSCKMNHFLLTNVFHRVNEKKYLSQIEKLAFEKNISSAFLFLNEKYEKSYNKQTIKYFTDSFPKVEFKTYDEVANLIFYLDYLLQVENKTLYEIGLKRLKKKEWENHEFSFILNELINQKGIKI